MESTKNAHSERQRTESNIFARFFICWVCPVLYTGNKRDVEEEDLVVPSRRYDSDRLGEKLEHYWLDEFDRASRENREPSLSKALVRTYWVAYMPGAILLIIITVARTVQPLLFAELLSYWSVNSEISQLKAGYYAIGMMGLNFIAVLAQHHNNLFVSRFSLRVKVACSSIIYRKVLRMNQTSLSNVAAGKLVNLLANDVARFDMAFMFLHYIWLVPVQVAVVAYFLYEAAGYAPFVGLFTVVVLILPVQAALTKYTAVIRRKVATRTDKRIKLMGEIINGIQIIKMYAWEKSFQQVVKLTRASELKVLGRSICVRSVFLGFMLFAERTTLFITSLMIVISGNLVTASMIYPIRQFLSIIQMNFTFILPILIASLSELKVSLERIQSVLMMEERPDMAILPKGKLAQNISFNGKTMSSNDAVVTKKYSELEPVRKSPTASREYAVELSGVNASWTNSENPENLTLKNISIRVKKGKLCAVIGHVGSGKSSLLQVLLRELPICGGNLNTQGKMAYACQESWLFPATVRENILFGLPYDAKKYKEVAKVCSLLPDFKQFPYGDLSLVGERGVSLSGGQRARINLARAVYREADVYLLDDPLSAVDANVGRQLFEGCIQGYLGNSTRILVTHQIHFLKAADVIVVLSENATSCIKIKDNLEKSCQEFNTEDSVELEPSKVLVLKRMILQGKIKNIGTYDELLNSEVEFTSLRTTNEPKDKTDEVSEKTGERPEYLRGVSKISVKSDGGEEQKEQIQAAEERSTGYLKFAVIWQYFSSVESWCVVLIALLTLLITQIGATFCDYWLSYWTNQVDEYEQALPEGIEPDPSFDTETGPLTTALYLIIYGSAVLFVIVMTQVRIQAFVVMTMRASKNLHNNMFKNLLGAVMRFFDTNPSGRVLNRFSKDTGAMDELLPRTILETFQMYLFVLSILVLNAMALPFTLIPTAVLMVIFVIVLKLYLNAAQAIKRLESTTKSPVFSMLNSTIIGISTIRCTNSQDRLIKTFDDAQDLNSSAFYTFLGANSAFGLYMDILCLVYLAVIIAIFLLIDFGSVIPVGSVGLAISQSMSLTMVLQMAARVTADFLAQMTSVERVLEYTNLPPEENLETGPTKPPKTWPSDGYLEFKKVDLRYGPEDPPVLKDLNFSIKSGWKVGIVGRTGAGKSSLISALFRLSTIDGSITIDGIDTKGIGKKELRSKISIIPQEPVLFNATLRYNLDPFDQYNDLDIWRALEQVELKDAIPALDFSVSEGGANFSVGQRQLVCLARAILRSNKILIMDEATANVDPQTDGLIQKTIRDQFAECTVLTIAHRLNTIMDSDRILVMDKGSVAEFDHPFILLSNPNSLLNFMVKETGEQMSDFLLEVARKKYHGVNPQSGSKED